MNNAHWQERGVMDENEEPKKISAHEVGMPLDTLSIDELELRIGLLEDEIVRLRNAIEHKSASRNAAEAVFKL
jgi:uncharacterized small protein (DUF1192 family)